MKEVSFIDFRTYANAKLNKIKESFQNQYAQYVMNNFGNLTESVNGDTLTRIAEINNLKEFNVLKDATYNTKTFDYFIYDDSTCIGVDNKGKIIYIDKYDQKMLSKGKVFESALNDSIKRQIKAINVEITRLRHEADRVPYNSSSYRDKTNHINELKKRVVSLAHKMD